VKGKCAKHLATEAPKLSHKLSKNVSERPSIKFDLMDFDEEIRFESISLISSNYLLTTGHLGDKNLDL
jgi:hypothetical protein